MALQLYNTLTRKKEAFEPLDPEHIRFYVCGPTVYDLAHIGNARPVVVFDVLFRLLNHLYPRVTYVRNITDIDDKINARAAEEGRSIGDLTKETTRIFHEDMKAIGALPPTVEPRATDHVGQMIEMIKTLITRDHAYEADGHVLFNVPSMPDYGGLSRRNREEQIDGARVEVAENKRDPADFVLWKPSDAGQPGWESPWGFGRPGWHIECSAMSHAYLGETFDIHGGGLDLIFPHHENEIAQSRCAFETESMAKIWMHNGFVTVEGEKMSKSAGNFYTVHDLLKDWPGEVIRMALLATHYRAPLDYTRRGLESAGSALDRLYRALRSAGHPHASTEEEEILNDGVLAALADDLNTPLAIARLHELAGAINRASTDPEKVALGAELRTSAALLGLLQHDSEAWFDNKEESIPFLSAEVIALIKKRQKARKARDFAKADLIRDELKTHGVTFEDNPDGTSLVRIYSGTSSVCFYSSIFGDLT